MRKRRTCCYNKRRFIAKFPLNAVKNGKMFPPRSCNTFVIMPPFTKTGDAIFGKNADRPQNEVQEIVLIKGGYSQSRKLKCTYVTIDQTSDWINDVILSKPAWMWGAEMGSNNKNVAIGNEAVWTNNTQGDADATVKRLLGMDLVRLGLERGDTAEEALDIITSLLELHGQGGPCAENDDSNCYHNSFLISDPREAWVLETSGKLWAAERVDSGWRNISNGLTITTKIDKHSRQLHLKISRLGLWDAMVPFNFKLCLSSGGDEIRQREGEKLLRESSSGFDIRDMMNILRNKDSRICRTAGDNFPTQASQVSSLSLEVSVHFFTGTADPTISLFKPFIFTPDASISEHTMSPNEGREHLLYKLHADFQIKRSDLTETVCPTLYAKLNDMETKYINDMENIQKKIKAGEVDLKEFDDLMKTCVEAEIKMYMP